MSEHLGALLNEKAIKPELYRYLRDRITVADQRIVVVEFDGELYIDTKVELVPTLAQ